MPRLENYSFGRIVVDGEEQTRDLIALPHRVFTNWWRREGHSLAIEDFSEVEDELPKKQYWVPARTAGSARRAP